MLATAVVSPAPTCTQHGPQLRSQLLLALPVILRQPGATSDGVWVQLQGRGTAEAACCWLGAAPQQALLPQAVCAVKLGAQARW